MKKIIALVLALTMVFALCACGSAAQAPAAAETPAPVVENTPAPPEGMQSTLPGAVEETAPVVEETNEARELAVSLIGEEISALIEKIGEPISSDYAPSCLGKGDDGELQFDGFVVYTYKDGDSEVIQDVE